MGPGRIARAHLRAILHADDLAVLRAVVGLPRERATTDALAREFGADPSSDLEATLSHPGIDAVVLTVPNHLHRSLAVQALEAGKHVLVEKPLANTLVDADAMIAAAERAGRTLMVAQCRRFFPAMREARAQIHTLGRPIHLIHLLGTRIESPATDWWRSSEATGGLILGLYGPHFVDTALWLIGCRPSEVWARGMRFRDAWDGIDEVTLTMAFPDDSLATGHLSYSMTPTTDECWVIGPSGTVHLAHHRNLSINGCRVLAAPLTDPLVGDECFDQQFREFTLAVRERRQPLASAAETRDVVAVLEAARRALAGGTSVVLG